MKAYNKYRIELLKKLTTRYQTLVERAYNLRQTDEGKSDYFTYEATKILQKINWLDL